MNRIISLAMIASFVSCTANDTKKVFEVSGTIKNAKAQMVYLEENTPSGRPTIMDSSQLKEDGSFDLKAPTTEENLYQLRLASQPTPFALFINDVPKLKVQADLNNTAQPYTIDGSTASKALTDFDRATYEKGMKLFLLGSSVDSLRKAGATDSLINATYAKVETGAGELKSYTQDVLTKSNSPILTLQAQIAGCVLIRA